MTNAIFFARKKYLTDLWTSCRVRCNSQLHAHVSLTPNARVCDLTQNLLAVTGRILVAFRTAAQPLRSLHAFFSPPGIPVRSKNPTPSSIQRSVYHARNDRFMCCVDNYRSSCIGARAKFATQCSIHKQSSRSWLTR